MPWTESIYIDPVTGKIFKGQSNALKRDLEKGYQEIFRCEICHTTVLDEALFILHKYEKHQYHDPLDIEAEQEVPTAVKIEQTGSSNSEFHIDSVTGKIVQGHLKAGDTVLRKRPHPVFLPVCNVPFVKVQRKENGGTVNRLDAVQVVKSAQSTPSSSREFHLDGVTGNIVQGHSKADYMALRKFFLPVCKVPFIKVPSSIPNQRGEKRDRSAKDTKNRPEAPGADKSSGKKPSRA